uniref:AlNc14C23G2376 protein n=1 Tax=Albugo laibachii Nc14 TaxID=890382 RepID=F0W677_9STRA|nr:AlNc14C23G2376 [Albugo laibachii Nc14]|eukprot:CCA16619.1 AlNc14C23G2376 [Albugo laibachii Nc14]
MPKDLAWMMLDTERYPETMPLFLVGHRPLYSALEGDSRVEVTDYVRPGNKIHRYIEIANFSATHHRSAILPTSVGTKPLWNISRASFMITMVSLVVVAYPRVKEGGKKGKKTLLNTEARKEAEVKKEKNPSKRKTRYSESVYGFAVFKYDFEAITEKVLYYYYEEVDGKYTLAKDQK